MEAYIVDACRTAGGKRNGTLAFWHPADLAGQVLNALVNRSGIDPAAIDDVIMGCVTQGGEQSTSVGRNAVLASVLPKTVLPLRSIVNADPPSRPFILPRRLSCPVRRMS